MEIRSTINSLADQFQAGFISSIKLVERCLERISDPGGEGHLAFLHLDAEAARDAARAADLQRKAGAFLSPLMGLPFSVKDLFDIGGQVTKAGSIVLNDAPPATSDALAISRLRQAGAIVIGRTNMTEFAYSGVGLNPHYGTPAAPYDRATRRIPGGSSSGAGVSVADGMATFAIGTDTGGSVRIPAAMCGITGFKPTRPRIPTDGVLPLSSSFDSVGPLAPSVACCITIDQVMAGLPVKPLAPIAIKGLRFLVPSNAVSQLDAATASTFQQALRVLGENGAKIVEKNVRVFDAPERSSNGARLLGAEAYAWHRKLLGEQGDAYDPRVSSRMTPAAQTSAADYIDLLGWRKRFVRDAESELGHYDGLLIPTTPHTAPPIGDLESSDEVYFHTNKLMLSNTSLINQIDGCALSIPCHRPGDPPVGLMLAGLPMKDEHVLRIGLSVESIVSSL